MSSVFGSDDDTKMKFRYESLFSTPELQQSLDLFSKTTNDGAKKAAALRGLEKREGNIDDPTLREYLKEYNTYMTDHNQSLKLLEESNKAKSTGRNQTILTQDMPKTILGGWGVR